NCFKVQFGYTTSPLPISFPFTDFHHSSTILINTGTCGSYAYSANGHRCSYYNIHDKFHLSVNILAKLNLEQNKDKKYKKCSKKQPIDPINCLRKPPVVYDAVATLPCTALAYLSYIVCVACSFSYIAGRANAQIYG
ncbi:MAG: hypothetical protein AAF900_01365, partial [Bacteroidota bacterium]